MEYEKLEECSKIEFESKEKQFSDNDLIKSLYGISSSNDWEWAQTIYIKYLNHHNEWVVKAAIKGLGDLVRVHKKIDKNKVLTALNKVVKKNPNFQEEINETISDIDIFKNN